jgi:hypothetical protein
VPIAGSFQVPFSEGAACYLAAIEDFDRQYGGQTTLTHILFVDLHHDKVQRLQGHLLDSKSSNTCETCSPRSVVVVAESLLLRVERKCTADGDFAAGSKFTQPVRSADKRSLAMKFSRFYLLSKSLVQSHSKLFPNFIYLSLQTHSLLY